MQLTKSLAFNTQNLEVEGFTNLGKHTPKHQLGVKGDHASRRMVQTLGCFLSKGSTSGTVLHGLLMLCIVLAERAGLRVDGIPTDGASWTRAMWTEFGVTEANVSVQHITDSSRRLGFFSDFPHMIKCLRNFFSKQDKLNNIWVRNLSTYIKYIYTHTHKRH